MKKIGFNGTKYVVAASEDEHISVFNTETEVTINCKPGHEGCSAKNASIDASGQFLASIGTDGFLNIYKLSEDSAALLKKVKITSKKIGAYDNFDISWLESESILVSGNK